MLTPSAFGKRIADSQGKVKPGFETWVFSTSARVRTGGFLLPGNAWRDVQGGIWQGPAGGKCMVGKVAAGGQAIRRSNRFPASSTQNSRVVVGW